VVVPAAANGDHDDTDTDTSGAGGGAASCDTDTVAVAVPAVTVTVPVRAEPVFSATDNVNESPLAPDSGATVSHDASLAADHDA
jgi:hypothetical protein